MPAKKDGNDGKKQLTLKKEPVRPGAGAKARPRERSRERARERWWAPAEGKKTAKKAPSLKKTPSKK